MAITALVCPTGCDDLTLPFVGFDDCDPEIKLSQLSYMMIALVGAAAFDDASLPEEWALRLSQTATPPDLSGTAVIDLIRTLTVVGDIPAPSVTEKDISGARKITSKVDRSVNLDIDEASALNYEFARATECGYFQCKAWFETQGGILLGGNSGITGKLLIHPVYGRGTDEIEKYTGVFTWTSTTSPDRCVSPIAH